MHKTARLLLIGFLSSLAILFIALPPLVRRYSSLNNSQNILQTLVTDPEFITYFGESLETLTILDTDSDGTPDVKDVDIDNDGVPNIEDPDVDGDGTSNSSDPSSALVNIVAQGGLTESSKGDKGDKGDQGDPGLDGTTGIGGLNGSSVNGLNGTSGQSNAGLKGDKGDTGTVGVIMNDGVIRTNLTGTELDIQLSLAAGSGLQKLSTGLSLTSSCNTSEVLKWNGSAWLCATDDGGITYTEGDGISISSGVVTALLGTAIDTSEIVDAAVTLVKLSSDSVNSSKIVDGSISSLDLGTGSVVTTTIQNGAVTEVKIADGAITVDKVASDSINSAKIVDGTVSTDDIADAAVTSLKLAASSVTTSKILDGTIATDDLADNLIVAAKLADGSVVTAKLADDVVTTLKLADDAVSLSKLANDAVNSAKIVDGSIVAADLADASVTLSKLDSCGSDGKTLLYFVTDPDAAGPLQSGWNCVDPSGEVDGVIGNEVADATVSGGLVRSGSGTLISPYTLGIASNGIVSAMINADAVTTAKILDGTIGTTDLADVAITTSKLADGSVNTQKLLDNSVATAKIADGAVTLVKIGADAIDSSKILDNSVTSSDIQDNAVAYSDIQQVAANSLLGNATGSSANVASIGLGSGLQFTAGNLQVASTVVTGLAAPSGSNANGGAIAGNVLTLSLVDGTNPGILSSADWTSFSAKVGTSRQLLAGTGLTGGGNLSVDRTLSLDIAGLTGLGGSIDNLDEVAIFDASSGSIRKVTRSDFLSGLTGALIYQGTYNAASNTPTLTDGTGTQGHYYVVGTAGTQDFGSGNITFATGDWVVHNGTAWEKLFNSVTVASVFGRTGTITAQSGDYTAVQVSNVPAGALAATNLQAAVNELDDEKLSNSLNSGLLFVGNGSNVATGVALSGDAGITSAGVLTLTAGSVTSGKILDGTIAADDLAVDSVTSTKILNGTIATDDLAANAVSYSKIQQAAANRLLGNATGGVADVAEIGLGTGLVFDSGNIALGSNAVLSLGTPSGSNANGGSITNNVLTLSFADASNAGLLSTGAQTVAGAKTFNTAASFTAAGTALSITNNALVGGGLTVSGNITNTGSISQTGTGTFSTGTGAITLNGDTTISGSNTFTTGTGLTTVSGDASVVGALALKKGTDYSVAGTSNDANFGSVSLVRLNGASAQTINGISGGTDGELLTIINAAAQAATISNQNSGSVAANRIITGTGTDINLAADASLSLVYDSGASRWRVVGGTGGSSSGGFSSLDIANDVDGGAIGTAVATVDTYANFNMVQTTASQAFTIPSPTNTTTTKGKIITINNIGIANFSISGVTVPAGSYGSAFVWNGTAWNPLNAATNVAAEYGEQDITNGAAFNNTIDDITGSTFTLPSAGVWEVGYEVYYNHDALSEEATISIYTSSDTIVPDSRSTLTSPGANFDNILTGSTYITTTGAATYKLRGITTSGTAIVRHLDTGSSNTGSSKVIWKKISGNTPVVGQAVNYISARSTTGQSGASGTLGFVGGNVLSSNNMSLVGNTFVANSAGTYRVRAEVMGSSATGFFESINLSMLKNGSVVYTTPNVTVAEIDGYGAFGVPYYIEQVVNLDAGDNVSFNWGGSGGSKAVNIKEVNINQLGSTAFTTVSMSALSAAIASNALDNANFAQTWNWSTATTETGLSLVAGTGLTSGTLQALSANSSAANFTGSLQALTVTGDSAADTGAASLITLAGSSSAAKGLQINNAGTGDAINVASTGAGLAANFGGAIALRAGTTYTTPGSANDVSLGNASYVKLNSSGAAQTLTGITGGVNGRLLTLTNAHASQTATLANQSTSSAASYRIITGTGADLTIAAGASVNLIYDSGDARWRVVGGTGGSSTGGFSSLDIANDADGGAIGTAVATVDTYTNFNIAQSTASQIFTIPNPTNTTTTRGKIVTINNTGTANFMIGGITVPAGLYGSAFVWNGTVWNPLNTASNVAAEYGESSLAGAQWFYPSQAIYNNVTGVEVTLPSAGAYQITAPIQYNFDNTSNSNLARLFDVTNNAIVSDSGVVLGDTDVASGNWRGGSAVISKIYTVTGPTTIRLQAVGSTGTANFLIGTAGNGTTKLTYEKVSGNTPVTGQTVDYVSAQGNSGTYNNATALSATTLAGNIPNSSGVFTLTAGKTYRLQGSVKNNTSATQLNYQWRDIGSGTALGTLGTSWANNAGGSQSDQQIAEAIFTPTVNTTVRLENVTSLNRTISASESWITITQLGSSAFTTVSMSALSAALAANTLSNANFTQTWNWDTLSTGNGLVANFNALTSGAGMNLASSSTGLTGSLARLDLTGDDAGVTGEAMLINIAGSSSAAKGLRIANAGTGLSADIQGAVAFRAGTTYTTPGSANNVAFANASFIRMDTSGAAQAITGIAGGSDGKLLTLSNVDATEAVTLVNLSGLSLAANQIVTGTGADLTLEDGASVSLIYDATDAKWRVVGGTGGGGSSSVVSNYYSAKGAVIDLDSAGTGTPAYVSLSTLASVVAGDYAGLTASENDPNGLRTSADTLTIDQSGAYRVSVNMQHTGANLSGVAGQNQLDELVAGYSRNGVFIPIQGNDDTNNLPQDVNGSVIVDLTASDTIRFGLANNASSFNDEDFIVNFTIEQVSGYAPVIGQSVDYVHVKKTTQQNVGTGAAVLFNTTESGNIPYNSATGEFTLTAGKTYRLESSLNGNTDGTTNGSVSMYWVNSANTALTTNAAATSTVATSSLANFSNSTTSLVYTPVTSMVVKLYTAGNVAATDVDGGWATVTQLGSSAVTVTDNVAQFGENSTITDAQTTTSTSYVDVAGSSFTLPSAGTWDVTYNVFTNNNTSAAITMMQLADSAGTAVAGSYSVMAEASGAGVTGGNWGRATITTTSATTYKLQWKVSGGTASVYNNTSSTGGSSKINWNKISGLTPTTGQSAEAASFKLGSSWTSGAGTFVNTWQTSPTTGSTTITSSGTNFVIPANKSFTVNLSLLSQTGVHSTFTVRDVTGGTPGTQLGSALSIGLSEGGNYSSSSAQTVYIPASGTARTVSIRLDSINSSNPTLNASSSGITFTQVGTTATTGVAMSSFVSALATNALDNANFGQTWSWNSLSTGDGLVIDSSSATASGNLLKFGLTNASATGTAVNITNAGTGLTLRINDDGTYADSTPVAVDANGRLIIGGTSGLYDLTFGDNDTGIDWESDGVVSFRRNGQEMFRLDGDVANQGFQFNVANALGGNVCDSANEVLETTNDGTLRCGSEDSDERLKNVYARSVLYGLDEILASELIQYDWNEESGRANDEGITRYQGFSAQNIEQIAPELVFESFGGTYGVDQNGLIATAWNGIKQLNEQQVQFATEIGAQVSYALESGALNGGIEVTGLSVDFGEEVTLAGALNYLSDKVGELDSRVSTLESLDPTVTNEITNVTNTTEQVTQNITQIIESTQQYGVAKVISGKGGVRVTFSQPYATLPAVFVTPLNGATYRIQDVTLTSFVIMLDSTVTSDALFNWMSAELDPSTTSDGEQIDAVTTPVTPQQPDGTTE